LSWPEALAAEPTRAQPTNAACRSLSVNFEFKLFLLGCCDRRVACAMVKDI
jgi:hypothetical protein